MRLKGLRHGSRSTYVGHKCRCELCTQANREYQARADVKAKAAAWGRKYRARPEVKEKKATYMGAYLPEYERGPKSRAQKRRYRRENKDTINARSSEYYFANKGRVVQRVAEYQKTPQGKAATRRASQTRRFRETDQHVEAVDPRVVYARHGGICGICHKPVSEDDFHVDHIIPYARGGLNEYENVQPAHPRCNRRKAAKLLEPA